MSGLLSRQALKDGTIERLIREDAVVGLTSNPTLFQKAIADGDAYAAPYSKRT